jgi:protein ImuA
MASNVDKAGLAALRRQVERLERGERPFSSVLPFEVPAIDRALPGNGLALGVLHELAGRGPDEEDGAVATAFLAGILARLAPDRPVLWCHGSGDLHAPGLALCGAAAGRIILARTRNDQEMLWALEEGLKTPTLAAVVGELALVPAAASRRLQLAAEKTGVTAFALRRWRTADAASAQRAAPLAAMTRWRVAAVPSALISGEPGVGRPLWQLDLLRCRGGVPASWIVEACDATGHVALSAELADRPVEARQAWAVG